MASRCLAVLAVLSVVGAVATELRESGKSRQLALEDEWGSELQPAPTVVAYQSPIKRVVSLLNKMKAELEHEAKHDAELYDKMVCWCETNDKEKTKAISDADTKDKALTSEIETRSARVGELGTNIKAMKTQVADFTKALRTGLSIREKEAAAFAGEQKSLTQALANVKNAIVVLSKHQSFLQTNAPLMMGFKAVLRDLAFKHELLAGQDASQRRSAGLRGAFISLGSESERASVHESTRMSRDMLNALDVEAAGDDTLDLKFAERLVSQNAMSVKPTTEFLQVEKPPGYSSASGAVFGMLKQLQSDFQAADVKAQADEDKAIADFKEVSAAKSAQIEASKQKLDNLEDEGSDNTKALSDAKEDLESTRDQRSADVKFLANLKTTCQDLDSQWKLRSKTRSDEITAVSQTLAIVTSDDNADMLRKSVTLLQLGSKTTATASLRAKAADVLRDGLNNMLDGSDSDDLLSAWEGRHNSAISSAADSLHSSRTQLAALAITVKLDTFTKVKEAMDKLVNTLKAQQTEEVEFNAKCVKDFNSNAKMVFTKKDTKEDLEAEIKTLASAMVKLDKEIAAARTQISETEVEVKKASQNREAENAQFQSVVADQRATQDILKRALAKLEGFYKKKAFMQMQAAQTPPGQFTSYKKSSASSPVMGMIQSIIEDSAQLESESVAGEKTAQTEYEKLVKDSNALIKANSDAVVEKSKLNADAKLKTATAKGSLDSTNGELDSLAKVETDLHNECDFVQKNFDIRQKARLTEMEAIQSAKGVLSGAK